MIDIALSPMTFNDLLIGDEFIFSYDYQSATLDKRPDTSTDYITSFKKTSSSEYTNQGCTLIKDFRKTSKPFFRLTKGSCYMGTFVYLLTK